MSRFRLRAVPLFTFYALIILTAACGSDSPTTPQPPPPQPPPPVTPVATRIAITPASATLTSIGQTVQLTARVFDQNDNALTNATVAWTSADTGVASVSSGGLVTSVGSGATRITARSGNVSQGAEVKVMLTVDRIVIEPAEPALMAIGETAQLAATVLDINGQAIAGASVTWQSSDEAVATVNATGLVTAVNNGMASITARSGDTAQSVTVTVMQTPAGIVIEPEDVFLTAIGQTVQLTARVIDQNDNALTDAAVAWTSADAGVASVGTGGLVTSVSYGTTRITARADSLSQSVEVRVMQTAGRIVIEPTEPALMAIGETVQLTATVLDLNEQTITGASVAWQSSDENVATVNAIGLVTAVNNGVAAITARSGDTAQSVTVTVMQTPVAIEIDPDEAVLTAIGETVQLAARVLDLNRRTIEEAGVAWQSSDDAVASVDGDGLVTAVNNGVASVTATTDDVSRSIDITVMQTPAGIVIEPDVTTLTSVGMTVQLAATVLDRNGYRIESAVVMWESSDESIAMVDDQGLVTGIAGGTVEITARSGMVSSVSSVTIKGAGLDREVLTALYHGTNGDGWTNNENWLSDEPLSDWHGVTTSRLGEVTSIQLRQNNLRGPIPAELCQLTALEVLGLQSNELTGNIPPELGLLTNLNLLWLGDNALTGEIPSELGQLTSLRSLGISSNELTGVIPPELGQLTSLTSVHLLNNKMTGNIPPELGLLPNLTHLDLDGNVFTGTIPHELGQTKLVRLGLSANELTGDIPLELTQLAGLTHLSLSSNRLTGGIPPELAQLTNLSVLGLGQNRLTGTIPPELAQLTNLSVLGLNENMLAGTIPPELAQLTNLTILRLNQNRLTGTIPPELAQLSKLKELWLSQNRLTGTIPPELGQLGSPIVLAFNDNNFTGGIPDELGMLTSLTWLWLHANPGLSGPLPDSFTGLVHMQNLELQNTGLCVPPTSEFQAWIDAIQSKTGVQYCTGS